MNGFYSEIIVDWLDLKVDQHIEERLPTLRKIYGHQRCEVIDWLDMMKDRRDTSDALPHGRAFFGAAGHGDNIGNCAAVWAGPARI